MLLAGQPAWGDSVNVKIEGVKGELADNVRAFLSVAAEHKDIWSARQIQRLGRRARGEIESALQPFGYYQPVITTALDRDGPQGDKWTARYIIDRGPPTLITKLELGVRGDGAQQASVLKALRASKLATGKRLVQSKYTDTKNAVIEAAYDAGYLDAKYAKSEIRVTPQENSAAVTLLLNTGPRYYFGPVDIQQKILDPAFAQRYVPFETGAPFDSKQLNNLQLALSDTGYFSQVAIAADRKGVIKNSDVAPENKQITLPRLFFRRLDGAPESHRPQLPIVVRTQPSKPQKYTASAGYGTDTGPRVGLGVEVRRLNSYGHKFRSDLQASFIKQALTAKYIVPIKQVQRDQFSIGATVKSEEFGDATSNSFALSASREDGWRLGRRRLYLNTEREIFDFGGPTHISNLLYPGLTLSFKRADNPLRTRRGVSLSADLHGGSDAVFAETNFAQMLLRGASVLPLGPRGRLLMRGELGATKVDDFSALPPSQRFFTGGDRSVRGYGYQTISPKNANNKDIGGRYLAVASVETDYLFYKDYGAALFFDAGDVSNSTRFDFKRGVGIGLRWRSPVGMVRLDFAHPLDDPDSNFHFHFSLGPDL